ncbi:MAG: putative DNA binding domain-containing protein [Deltaproteobacteria bacterium]|nr:putative DNA binding domain-containing protein [Deltaproteobacteria bacterium]
MLTADQVRALAADLESDRVERTISTTNTEKFREAIGAFANDMPGHGLPGYLLIGVADDGAITGVAVTDRLLLSLADRRDDGQIQPIPSMSVYQVRVGERSVVVVEVQPSEWPPVSASGRVWIRVGPRRALASTEDERRLSERRVSRARTFDQRPCPGSSLDDLLLEPFINLYLPKAVAPEVLGQNQRDPADRLASLRFVDPASRAPTHAGVLMFGLDPLAFLPGAYVQFVRFDGTGLEAPVQDSKRLSGNVLTQLQELDTLLPMQIRVAREPGAGLRHEERADYPLAALRESARWSQSATWCSDMPSALIAPPATTRSGWTGSRACTTRRCSALPRPRSQSLTRRTWRPCATTAA